MTRWRTRHRRLPGDRGAAAVEFAIVLTVLLIIIFGIIDFGRLLFVSQGVKSASREGARTAVVNTTSAPVTAVVTDSVAGAQSLAGGQTPTIVITNGNFQDTDGNAATPSVFVPLAAGSSTTAPCPTGATAVEVSVRQPFDWFTPAGFIAQNVNTVSSSTTMRCE